MIFLGTIGLFVEISLQGATLENPHSVLIVDEKTKDRLYIGNASSTEKKQGE